MASARTAILRAACERIAAEGIDAVRIAHIAADAGVSTALVHYHFATRDALLAEALEFSFDTTPFGRGAGTGAEGIGRGAGAGAEGIGRGAGTGAEGPAGPDGAPAIHAARLAARVEACLPGADGRRVEWALWIELWSRAARVDALRPVAERLYARYHAWLAEVVAAGVEAGEFAPCDVDAVVDRALALIDGLSVRVVVGDGAMEVARVRAEVLGALARELALPVAPALAAR